ncbi:MAG: DUF1003 domain-containing protein [Candidatus Peribacteraceae bacterium]|nr:DUF1003 domain-containing protein [Candidatus Peribacteraceae bacterium]
MTKKIAPETPQIAEAIERNIRALREIRRQLEAKKTTQDRIADTVTGFSGNLLFVYFHVLLFSTWILWNTGMLGLEPFDVFPFGLLTTFVSLEAIFLSTFVLVSQKRLTEISDKRSDLDLQINLLTEYEVTKILLLTDAIADHLGLTEGQDPEFEQLKKEISPEKVLQEMEKKELRN